MGFLRSFVYAGRGIWFCIRHERNFRIHMSAAIYVLLFAPYFSLTRGEWAALLAIIGLVTAAEAVNTAVEQTVNLAAPRPAHEGPRREGCCGGGPFCCAQERLWLSDSFSSPAGMSGRVFCPIFGQTGGSRCFFCFPFLWRSGLSSVADGGRMPSRPAVRSIQNNRTERRRLWKARFRTA